MNLWQKISRLWGNKRRERISQNTILNALLAQARLTYYAENYPTALELLEEAERIAHEKNWSLPLIEIHFERAVILRHQHAYDAAEELLKAIKTRAEAQQLRPVTAYALCHLAQLDFVQARYDSAQARADRAHAVASHIYAKGALARAKGLQGMIALAQENSTYAEHALIKAIQHMLKTTDHDLLPYLQGQLAHAYHKNDKPAQSNTLFQTALQNAADRKDIYALRHLSLMAGECARARTDHARAQHHYQNALSLFAKYNPSNPDHVRDSLIAHAQLARLLHETDPHAARDHAQKAAELTQAQPTTPQEQALVSHALGVTLPDYDALTQAHAYYSNQGSLRERIEIIITLAQHAPTSSIQKVHLQEALALAEAKHNKLSTGKIHGLLGEWHAQHETTANALIHWHAATESYRATHHHAPLMPLFCQIAQAHEASHHPHRALKAYDEALLYLGDVSTPKEKIHLLGIVARVHARKGDVASADAFYTDALALATPDSEAHITLMGEQAWLYIQSNRPAQGIATLTHTRTLARTQHWHTLWLQHTDWLGVGYALLGETDTALHHHHEALNALTNATPPDLASACYLHLAQTLYNRPALLPLLRQHLERAYALAQQTNTPTLMAQIHQEFALLALMAEDMPTTQTHLEHAHAALSKTYDKHALAMQHRLKSQYRATLGDVAQAQTEWQTAQKLYAQLHSVPPRPFWLPETP